MAWVELAVVAALINDDAGSQNRFDIFSLNDLDGIDLTRTLVNTFLDERECSFTNLRIINNNQS